MRYGSNLDPPNRFESVRHEADFEHLAWDRAYLDQRTKRPITYIEDESQSIISENDSPDIPFRYSLNPYRGCAHGCPYCYARNTHEFLGLNAGLDFETKIVVKRRAPELLREFLRRKKWEPEPIAFSGVTDCYQPAEREFRLTRQCLEVAAECRQPIGTVTKNALVTRDLDLLQSLAANELVHVWLSITTLDTDLARDMEPRTSIPAARLRAIKLLAEKEIPVGVFVAPIIPGLNDSEIPQVLEAAKEMGALSAGYTLLRLPLTVEPVFIEWLKRTRPLQADRVLGRIRETRNGSLDCASWGERMTGRGEMAEQIASLFRVFKKKLGLDRRLPPQRCDLFRPPVSKSGQPWLF